MGDHPHPLSLMIRAFTQLSPSNQDIVSYIRDATVLRTEAVTTGSLLLFAVGTNMALCL